LKPEHRAVVVNELVLGVEVVEQFDDLSVGLGEILVVEPILRRRALPDRNDEIVPIVGNGAVEA
jgi:hypothetical protein